MGFASRSAGGKGGRDDDEGVAAGGTGRGGRAAARKAASSWSSLKQKKVSVPRSGRFEGGDCKYERERSDDGDYGAGYKRKVSHESDDDY